MKEKSIGISKWILFLIFFTVILIGFIYHKQLIRFAYKSYRFYHHRFNHSVYSSGMTDYPYGYSVHGIDVSRWQDKIDWTKVKSKTLHGDTVQYQFAFIKATEGIWIEDPMFKDNWRNAAKNKMIRGAYHYFIPGENTTLQSRNFFSSVNLVKGDLPPVVDVEETRKKSKAEIVKCLKLFLRDMETHYKVKPIIYSNINFIEDFLADDFTNYNFWIAHYYEYELTVDQSIKWVFWQHNDRGGIFGCLNPVDVNVFNGNRNELNNILLK